MKGPESFTKHPSTPPQQDRRIFAFTGLPGVGKSAVAKEFAGFAAYPIVNMGEEMKRQYESLPEGDSRKDTPKGTWEMAQALRDEHGEIGPALASATRIAACFVESNVVVVDGVRSPAEVQFFEEVFHCPVHLIKVTADEETRLERFYERGDYDEMDDVNEAAAKAIAEYEMNERTEREAEEGLRDAIRYANYEIDNNGTLDDAGLQVARLFDHFDPLL